MCFAELGYDICLSKTTRAMYGSVQLAKSGKATDILALR